MAQISIFDLQSKETKSSHVFLEDEKNGLINTSFNRTLEAHFVSGGSGTVSLSNVKDYGPIIPPVEFGLTDDPVIYSLPKRLR